MDKTLNAQKLKVDVIKLMWQKVNHL